MSAVLPRWPAYATVQPGRQRPERGWGVNPVCQSRRRSDLAAIRPTLLCWVSLCSSCHLSPPLMTQYCAGPRWKIGTQASILW